MNKKDISGTLGFLIQSKRKGDRIVTTAQIMLGDSNKDGFPITEPIVISYEKNGKSFVRESDVLWKKGYMMKCTLCSTSHRLPPSIINALVILAEGTIKVNRALQNHAFDGDSLN